MNLIYTLNYFATRIYRNKIFNKTIKNQRIPPPSLVVWDCTRRCNLHCEHCGAAVSKPPKEIAFDEIKKIIDDVARMKVNNFFITGGEPLIREDIFEILNYIHHKGLKSGIATNGYFIDRQKAEKLKNAHTYSIQISIDGLKKIHNLIRGNNESYDKAVKAIGYLKGLKIPLITVASTISKKNLGDLTNIKNLLVKLKVNIWRICIIMPIGRAKDVKHLLLSPKELIFLLEFVKRNKTSIKIYFGENLPYLLDCEDKIRQEPFLCPVGITTFCIGTDGKIRGCPEQTPMTKFIEGDTRKQSIDEIWQKGFQKYRLNSLIKEDNKCSMCRSKNKCFGGCRVMRLSEIHCIYKLLGKLHS